MILDNINDLVIPDQKSIIVLGTYRSGTTALCDHLSKKYNLKNYDEVFHDLAPEQTDKFIENIADGNNKYVIKIMPTQINDSNRQLISQLIDECFVIKCYRKNVLNQIRSMYICHMTNVWHYRDTSKRENFNITVDDHELEMLARYVVDVNRMLENLSYRIDAEITYEKLNNLTTEFKLYQRPNNDAELIASLHKVKQIQGW